MPDDSANPITQNNDTTTPPADNFAAPAAPAQDTVGLVDAGTDAAAANPSPTPADAAATESAPASRTPADVAANQQMYADIASKISEAHNILIALSSDPSVDEMAAAIGLSLFLDKLGKRATAIYSGTTPNALEFLKPEETFETTADVLQDFVIALNKEKADHLRYKLDGDFVKIYITPYQSKITPEDLEFSYGDFNVDLVLSLDIANGIDLDSALREHGRIMHDAVIINITTGNPGKFGEIEWSDKRASSVSEMVANLLYSIKSDVEIGKEEATAFLTGIVAATNRFSNANTTPETMEMSSKLMNSGANQQLISKNITPDVDNEMALLSTSNNAKPEVNETAEASETAEATDEKEKTENDPANFEIKHDGEKDSGEKKEPDEKKETEEATPEEGSSLLDDLKAAEASLAQTGSDTTPDTSNQPVRLDGGSSASQEAPAAGPEAASEAPAEPKAEPEASADLAHPYLSEDKPAETSEDESSPSLDLSEPASASETPELGENNAEKVIAPPSDFSADTPDAESDKYGRMLEEALSDLTNPGSATALNSESSAASNPATASTPAVSSTPEINGVPEMNFMPPAGESILPPPPAPPIDMSAGSLDASLPTPAMAAPATPATPTTPAAPTAPAAPVAPAIPTVDPAAASAVTAPTAAAPAPQSTDAGAFKIPGM